MKEIEILFEIKGAIKEAKMALDLCDWQENVVIDTYYESLDHQYLSPDQNLRLKNSFRIRERINKNIITFKEDKFDHDGVWLYSDEFEIKIEDVEMFKKILNKIHFKELIKIINKKYTKYIDNYEIVLEEVKDLGNFLEVEYKDEGEIGIEKVEEIKEEIRNFVKNKGLKIGKELDMGKPEMMLRKLNLT